MAGEGGERQAEEKTEKEWDPYDHIVWFYVYWYGFFHLASLYAIYLILNGQVPIPTLAFAVLLYLVTVFGVTAGDHRLWSHRSYKAKTPLRILLATFITISHQKSIFEWCRDHRVHHKYSETDADPVNFQRGFFFAHIGWLLTRKHPDVFKYGARIDNTDMLADPIVYYQKKYYGSLALFLCFIIPTLVPWYYWNESLLISFLVPVVLRYTACLNVILAVNSFAHVWGTKPYDVHMTPSDNNLVAFFNLGEGWHNFHHAFPWDYNNSEWGFSLNLTSLVLQLFGKIGWAYDFRTVSKTHIRARISRTGPGTKLKGTYREHEY